jgi:hypothetical protein
MDFRSQRELESLLKEDPEMIRKKLYDAASGLSFLLLNSKTQLNDIIFSENELEVNQRPDERLLEIKKNFEIIRKNVHGYSRELGSSRFFYAHNMESRVEISVPSINHKIRVPKPLAMISLVLETSRMINSRDNRVILGLIDILRGDWKDGTLIIMQFFQESPDASLFKRVLFDMLEFVEPDLQEDIASMKTPKQMAIAFITWIIATLVPDPNKKSSITTLYYKLRGVPVQESKNLTRKLNRKLPEAT